MKHRFSIFIFCLIIFSVSAEDNLVIPAGIRYKQASAKVNDDACKLLMKLFSASDDKQDILPFFETHLICGPGLWLNIKSEKAMTELKKGNAVFEMPVINAQGKVIRKDKMGGKLFQTPEEILAFWKVFAQRTDFSGFKIRKLNQDELRIFWAMIPFDITEPIFIIESSKHKILILFTSAEKLKIMWIDDYQNLRLNK